MADLCEVCFRPARWLVLKGAQPKWPLEGLACGYHTEGRQRRVLTGAALAEKRALDARYDAEFGCHPASASGVSRHGD